MLHIDIYIYIYILFSLSTLSETNPQKERTLAPTSSARLVHLWIRVEAKGKAVPRGSASVNHGAFEALPSRFGSFETKNNNLEALTSTTQKNFKQIGFVGVAHFS